MRAPVSWGANTLTSCPAAWKHFRPARTDSSAVSGRLDAVEVGVAAAAGKQFLMAARLRDAGAVEYHDEVGHADRAEPVRDQDGHAPLPPGFPGGGGVALEQLVLGLRVERRRRLVERDEERLVAHEPARQGELLPLAVRHVDALVPGRAKLGAQAGR